jgi:hypothetical protein
MPTPTNEEKIKQISKEAHVYWLSRAKTVKIDGTELTVLPYGFLSQAVEKSGAMLSQ